jgi:hypothetical protein
MFWGFISDENAHLYKTVIQSWFYDDELKLFVIKRLEGCQYLTPALNHFHSLCESDLMDLGRKHLINYSNNDRANHFARLIHYDYLNRYKDDYDETKRFIKPRKLKKVVNEDGSVSRIQRPVKCYAKVPAKKWKQNMLGLLDNWKIDKNTGEAKMFADRRQEMLIMSMYDPMQVVNLSRSDLRRLYDANYSSVPFWKNEERKYRKIIQVCLHERIHANSRKLLFDG